MNPISTILLSVCLFTGCSTTPTSVDNESTNGISTSNVPDTAWSPDKREFEVGDLIEGKKIGAWHHYYLSDSTRWEERHYLESEKMISCRFYSKGTVYLEEDYLSDGMFSVSYYSNGCINSMGYHRTVDGVQGEMDGTWVQYDSLGNLFSETVYNYREHRILYKEYEPAQHFLTKECEYYQESGESTCYKNGTWKYYKNGKPDHTERHDMESTLDEFGK